VTPQDETPPLVVASGLTRTFGEVTAVDDLSFDVGRGELFGIVGPDGAGKTTTLRILAGVLRPTRGDATVDGVSVARDPERVKASIAYMSQRFGLYDDLTVAENLRFYADLYCVPRHLLSERIDRMYEFSRLGPFEHRLAGQLSGGMKQKLSLSCALIHRPRLLLLDEPTFGVDPVSRRELWLIVHEMVAAGTTAVVSTSYLDEAERFDRVALLYGGRVASLGAPAELQRTFPGEIIAVWTDRPRPAVRQLRELQAVRAATLFGHVVHVTLDRDSGSWPEVRRQLEESGIRVREAAPMRPSLEDVFIARVRGWEADA